MIWFTEHRVKTLSRKLACLRWQEETLRQLLVIDGGDEKLVKDLAKTAAEAGQIAKKLRGLMVKV